MHNKTKTKQRTPTYKQWEVHKTTNQQQHGFIKLVAKKSLNAWQALHFIFSSTRLINSLKHEHSCKILYLSCCSNGQLTICITSFPDDISPLSASRFASFDWDEPTDCIGVFAGIVTTGSVWRVTLLSWCCALLLK